MEGDAISGLLGIFKEEGYNKDIQVREGKIISVSPFKVSISSTITFDEDDVKMSYYFKRQLDNNLGKVMIGSTEYIVENQTGQEVKPGDIVIGLIDGDEYYIIDRMV